MWAIGDEFKEVERKVLGLVQCAHEAVHKRGQSDAVLEGGEKGLTTTLQEATVGEGALGREL